MQDKVMELAIRELNRKGTLTLVFKNGCLFDNTDEVVVTSQNSRGRGVVDATVKLMAKSGCTLVDCCKA